MPNQTSERQQALAKIDEQFKAGSDRLIETICKKIRSTEPGQTVTLNFCKEIPTKVAQALTERAIEITQRQGYQIFGLIIDFEPD